MEVPMLLCSESAAVDQRKNTISAFHVLEEIGAASLPWIVLRLYIIAIFVRESDEPIEQEDVEFRVYLDDRELARTPIDINFRGHTRLRLITEVQGIVVDKPGLLKFVIFQKERQLASWTIPVRLIARQEPQMDMPFATPLEEASQA